MKGRGFVDNNDFPIFNGNSLNFMIFHENTEIHEFTRISQNCKEIAPLRRRVKTAVIQMYFNHSGAHFLPQTSQNQFFGVSSVILLDFVKFLSFH